jgi:excisionase family DNA binding protein
MVSTLPHSSLTGVVLEWHISVRAAAEAFGYNQQYLRRLLRTGRMEGTKLGQVWLIKLADLERHLQRGQAGQGRRRGPQEAVVEQQFVAAKDLVVQLPSTEAAATPGRGQVVALDVLPLRHAGGNT